MNNSPKIFISYSHDSEVYKSKVRDFADQLRFKGVDVTGDFYDEDMPAGADFAEFGYNKMQEAQIVIILLSPGYKLKANEAKKGGVHYEGIIIRAEIFNGATEKFIPVTLCEEFTHQECLPHFILSTTKAILRSSFSSDALFIERVVRHVHKRPEKPKPPLGPSPFENEKDEVSEENTLATDLDDHSPLKVFRLAKKYAETNDKKNFKQLAAQVKEQVFRNLSDLIESVQKETSLDEFINHASPLFLVTFAGYVFNEQTLVNPENILIDLLYLEVLNHKNYHIAKFLVYVYLHLFGAVAVKSERLQGFVKILDEKIPAEFQGKHETLCEIRRIMVWLEIFERLPDCRTSFDYLKNAYNRWNWLVLFFESEEIYLRALVCCQMSACLINFFRVLKNNNSNYQSLSVEAYKGRAFDVPPVSIYLEENIRSRVEAFIIQNRTVFLNYLKDHVQLPIDIVCTQWRLFQINSDALFSPRSLQVFSDNFIVNLLT